jgi:hypothetical protein
MVKFVVLDASWSVRSEWPAVLEGETVSLTTAEKVVVEFVAVIL